MNSSVLVVDDEISVRNSLARVLRSHGYAVRVADSAREALGEVKKIDPDVVLLDVCLPDTSGLDVLVELKQINRRTPVIAMSAYGNARDAILAMKRGAYDYLSKPLDIEAMRLLVKEAIESTRLADPDGDAGDADADDDALCPKCCPNCSCPRRHRPGAATCDPRPASGCERMIGASPAMRRVFELLHRLPPRSASNVLIEGETGTGKELLARAIHQLSNRAAEPFVAICSSAIPRDLIESELFGYEGGAYTGARAEGRVGVFEAAGAGTIFLDEIGELDLKLQVKLLRVLETREFWRVGGTKRTPLRARLIAATNRHLKKEVEEGRFRADLYYRLNVLCITLPPLRERTGDIALLADTFRQEFNVLFDKNFGAVSPAALRLLEEYTWPGNVREMRNVIERIALVETGDSIMPNHLPPEILGPDAAVARPSNDDRSSGARLLDAERDCIIKALKRAGGNVVNAARLLGVKRGALRYRMERLGISKIAFVPRSPEDLPGATLGEPTNG